MNGRSIPRVRGVASAALIAAALVACDAAAGPTTIPPDLPAPEVSALTAAVDPGVTTPTPVNRALAELRRATARFHDIETARRAGHEVLVRHPESGAACLSHPRLGAMGHHYLDPALADDQVSAGSPEVVIYERGASGELRLVAVEYLVPFAIRGPDQPAPTLFGREFSRNSTFQVWALHAWVWKHNPSGMFADWNPAVSCEGA